MQTKVKLQVHYRSAWLNNYRNNMACTCTQTTLKFKQCTFIKYSFKDISKSKHSNLSLSRQRQSSKVTFILQQLWSPISLHRSAKAILLIFFSHKIKTQPCTQEAQLESSMRLKYLDVSSFISSISPIGIQAVTPLFFLSAKRLF